MDLFTENYNDLYTFVYCIKIYFAARVTGPDCVHVVVVVGLVCLNDLWGYTLEPLMPGRSKVRFQTKRDTGVYAVRGWLRFTSRTCLLLRHDCASEPVSA